MLKDRSQSIEILRDVVEFRKYRFVEIYWTFNEYCTEIIMEKRMSDWIECKKHLEDTYYQIFGTDDESKLVYIQRPYLRSNRGEDNEMWVAKDFENFKKYMTTQHLHVVKIQEKDLVYIKEN